MRLREIAEAFGLTESRICQIHAQAVLAIKSFLQKHDPYLCELRETDGGSSPIKPFRCRLCRWQLLPKIFLEKRKNRRKEREKLRWHTHCLDNPQMSVTLRIHAEVQSGTIVPSQACPLPGDALV